ncbi:MAG: alpha/beta fold hydrolase [Pseudomonadota bacterium]
MSTGRQHLTNCDDDRATNRRNELISQVYELALRKEISEDFVDLWQQYLHEFIDSQITGDFDDTVPECTFNDQEIESHFSRAYMLLERSAAEGIAPTIKRHVEAQAGAAIVFTAAGDLAGVNKEARAVFGAIKTLSELQVMVEADDFEKLEAMLLRTERIQTGSEVHLFSINVAKAGRNEPASSLFIARAVSVSPGSEAFLSISALAVGWSSVVESLIGRCFGLTLGELQTLRELVRGLDISAIAQTSARSVHTVRTQVKSILSKTGTSSQTALVRMMTLLANEVDNDTSQISVTEGISHGERYNVSFPAGDFLPVNVIGPEDGNPVVFFHGVLDGFAFHRGLPQLCDGYGIRMVLVSRPAFGDSPPCEAIARDPLQIGEPIERVLDALDIDEVTLFGHMAGSLYAAATAAALDGRVQRVFSAAGGVPISSGKQFRDMSPRQRMVALTARFTPALLPTILRAGIAQINSGGEDDFMESLYREGTQDHEVLNKPETRRAVLRGYAFSVAQGQRAFVNDSRHIITNWNSIAQRVKAPWTLFHGAKDGVVSIESVRTFAASHRNVELRELPDAGQLLMYEHADLVFRAICEPHSEVQLGGRNGKRCDQNHRDISV